MPNKMFLETYPLYRKFNAKLPSTGANQLEKVSLTMACPPCQSEQTFIMTNEYHESLGYVRANSSVAGAVLRLRYVCAHCQRFERLFFVAVASDSTWIMKVGQYPSWNIKGDPHVEKLLGLHADYYQKGLICESQGYGIGAFGYYRRIVEEIIGQLLSQISDLMTGEELKQYEAALALAHKTTVAQEKIDLVKELLPPILRPNGMNPLSALHSALSAGLHAGSDEECLELAEAVRVALLFLVDQVVASKTAAKGFTESMKKILAKKPAKGI